MLDGLSGLKGAKPVNKNEIDTENDGKDRKDDDGWGEGASGVRIDPDAELFCIYSVMFIFCLKLLFDC